MSANSFIASKKPMSAGTRAKVAAWAVGHGIPLPEDSVAPWVANRDVNIHYTWELLGQQRRDEMTWDRQLRDNVADWERCTGETMPFANLVIWAETQRVRNNKVTWPEWRRKESQTDYLNRIIRLWPQHTDAATDLMGAAADGELLEHVVIDHCDHWQVSALASLAGALYGSNHTEAYQAMSPVEQDEEAYA